MDEDKITIDGKEHRLIGDKRQSLIDLLEEKNKSYEDNPTVAALVDGELMPLDTVISRDMDVKSIKLFSPLGKRVYRKTLCFLLCYASAKLFPERTLIIGHSLGDGFYFYYREREKPDIEKLKDKMRRAIDEDLPIENKILSSQ